jgi:hypothetical protein
VSRRQTKFIGPDLFFRRPEIKKAELDRDHARRRMRPRKLHRIFFSEPDGACCRVVSVTA